MVCGASARSTCAGRDHGIGTLLSDEEQCRSERIRVCHPPPLRRRLLLPHRQHLAQQQRAVGTVFYKNGESMTDFALWPREAEHKPTYCIWELVPLWHEQEAWEGFLKSSRDEPAAMTWLSDHYTGPA